MRRVAMALQHDPDLTEKVLSSVIDPAQLAEKTFNPKNNTSEIGKLLFNENRIDQKKQEQDYKKSHQMASC